MATSKEMTAGPALPLIFNFTLPLLFGNLLQQTYSLVDAAIVGKFLGINALASVGASTSVVFLILGFCNGCCGGFGIHKWLKDFNDLLFNKLLAYSKFF